MTQTTASDTTREVPPDGDRLDDFARELDGVRASRDTSTVVIAAVAALALLASLVGVGFGMRAIDESGGAPAGAGGAAGGSQVVEVELGDLFVRPSSIEVAAGTELIVEVTNNGAMPHDLKLDGGTGTEMLDPGASEQVSLGVVNETAQAWCTVAGHKEAGMVLDIEVTGAAAAPGAQALTAGEDGAAAEIDMTAEPTAEFTPFDPTLAPAPGGTEHEVTIAATETVVEVAPGVTQEMWLFDDQYPGPVLRGQVGDIFTVTLVNEGEMGHSIDFHASKVAWNDEMRTIEPGESLVYQFEAKHAGVFMYHCGTAPALHHIGNGMFGAI
ncbi:MAG TPA: multicopper oxidase domain-containing protein, partial [Acidimicrobiales bacterium]